MAGQTAAAIPCTSSRPSQSIAEAVYALLAVDRDGAAADSGRHRRRLRAEPDRADHVEAAAVPLAGLSAWQALFDHGHLQRG